MASITLSTHTISTIERIQIQRGAKWPPLNCPASEKKAMCGRTLSNTKLSAEQNVEQEHSSIWNIVSQNVRYLIVYSLMPPLNPLKISSILNVQTFSLKISSRTVYQCGLLFLKMSSI